MKHVRSEKNPHSTVAMIETNVFKFERVLDRIAEFNSKFHVFSVSSDKAVNPTSYMGLSKKLMEHCLFNFGHYKKDVTSTSARFANVLFSNGSLPQSWEDRFRFKEAIPCPKNCKRYFITHLEAAQLCILAAVIAPDRSVLVPRMDPANYLMELEELACSFIDRKKFTPVKIDAQLFDEIKLPEMLSEQKYPLLLSELDTAGEKSFEEFSGAGEHIVLDKFRDIEQVIYDVANFTTAYARFRDEFRLLLDKPINLEELSFQTILNLVTRLAPEFRTQHKKSELKLDERR